MSEKQLCRRGRGDNQCYMYIRSSAAWEAFYFLPWTWKRQVYASSHVSCKPWWKSSYAFVSAHYYWKASGIHNPSAKHTSEVLLSLILSRRELSHGRSHFPKPIRRVVTESELKCPGFHPLKCCCCRLFMSFLLSAALQISLALCFLLLWCSLSQRCKAVVSPCTYYLIFYLGCIDSFQSLAQSKAIIVQLPVYWELKLWLNCRHI